MGFGTNRKKLKKKKRSCPMCKPHKMGGAARWKNRLWINIRQMSKRLEKI